MMHVFGGWQQNKKINLLISLIEIGLLKFFPSTTTCRILNLKSSNRSQYHQSPCDTLEHPLTHICAHTHSHTLGVAVPLRGQWAGFSSPFILEFRFHKKSFPPTVPWSIQLFPLPLTLYFIGPFVHSTSSSVMWFHLTIPLSLFIPVTVSKEQMHLKWFFGPKLLFQCICGLIWFLWDINQLKVIAL